MRSILKITAAALLGTVALAPLGASAAKRGVLTGTVVHVSNANIKIKDLSGKTTSFLIVPKFHGLKNNHGHDIQMQDIAPGDKVKIVYDRGFLGRAHADQIIDYRFTDKGMKS